MHEDLGLKSHALRRAPLLTQKQRENRLAKCHALLNNLKHETYDMLRFFSDERNFNQHQKVNAKTDTSRMTPLRCRKSCR